MRARIWWSLVWIPWQLSGQPAPAFRSLRYDESYLAYRDSARTPYNRLKYQPVGRRGYLSVGGEVRYQHLFYRNEDWGQVPGDRAGFFLTRYMFHADAHWGPSLRTFVQLTSNFERGRQLSGRTIDENQLDLHQAFVDWKRPLGRNRQLTARVGRQEMQYGTQRLVSVREGPNVRQSFDGAKLILTGQRLRLDGFFTWFVPNRTGVFDDRFDRRANIRFWGLYGVLNQVKWLRNADVYYLSYHSPRRVYEEGIGPETRHSAGTRIWGGGNGWKYDMEALYQFGSFNNVPNSIRAWTVSTNVNYTTQMGLLENIGLKTELISGDLRSGDGRLETFNPLFPRGAYFGLAALIGPANLFDIHPSVDLRLAPKVSFTTDYDVFWRLSAQDGIYGPVGNFQRSGRQTTERLIGHQFAGSVEYNSGRFFRMSFETACFLAGGYLRASGPGKNLFFMATTLGIRF
jgi:hypothetical protein